MKCSNCGTQNPADARFCRRCSAALPRDAQVELDTKNSPAVDISTAPLSKPLGTRPFKDEELAPPDTTPATDSEVTQQLPRRRYFFEALPTGALVGGAPYEILQLNTEDDVINGYAARARLMSITCKSCAFSRNVFGDEYCQQCGALLAGIEPHRPRYILRESVAPDAIAIERRLADMRLHHGGVLFPLDTFSESIANTRRYYVVIPEPSAATGTKLSVPQELSDVLSWGIMLAESLTFMHTHKIAFGEADLSHISLDNNMARWFNFTSAHFVEPKGNSHELFKDDIASLATSLFMLLTGQIYSPDVALESDSLKNVFADVFRGQLTEARTFADRLRSAFIEVRRPASYDLRTGRTSDVGQLRQLNEDSLLTLEAGYVHRSESQPIGLYVVADGAGGHAAGDIASGIVVRTLAHHASATLFAQQFDGDSTITDINAWLNEAVQMSNQAVNHEREVTRNDMGTTLVMAVVLDGKAHTAHIGDSRAYVVNESGIQQITTDHSWVQRMVDTGQITPEEARTHERRNVIYKMIGDRPQVEPDFNSVTLNPGDQLLLCSDGLSGPVDDADIHEIVMSSSTPQVACQRLIDAANHAGGPDNITAVIVQIESIGTSK